MMPFAPETHQPLIIAAFTDAGCPAYGQVSTVSSDGAPQVRTVHFHYIPERAAIAFNSHNAAPKWKELQRLPIVSGCYVDLTRLAQIRWQGRVALIEGGNVQDDTVLQLLWSRMRPDVRAAYWSQYLHGEDNHVLDAGVDVDARCPTCCTVLCFPTHWDIYEINPADYRAGRRTIHVLQNGRWESRQISLLYNR